MVKILKYNVFWTVLFFIIILLSSILSKWFGFLDFGIFNYSLLLVFFILLPNLKLVFNEIKNSEIEIIKLPFCELKLLKKYDYYFIGNMKNDLRGDLVVLAFYKGILNEEEALLLFNEEFVDKGEYDLTEIIKQVHYKKNDK